DGTRIVPNETTAYADARLVHKRDLGGPHEFVAGAAFTYGKLKAAIEEFDMTFTYIPIPRVPNIDELTINEGADAETERHFFGAFVHDTWTPQPRITLGAGGRVDLTGEDLEGESSANPGGTAKDRKENSAVSGDGSLLVRLLPPDMHDRMVANVYANARRNFKPAAPNVLEAEGLKILEPETSVAYEGGLKLRGFEEQV